MRHNTPVTTMAAALALALALLVGVLLPSDSVVHAAEPEFADTDGRSVPENTPPGVNIGVPISATDADEDSEEFGNTLTYSLGGDDAASFDIDPSTGQLITKAPLDEEAKSNYSVTVTVDDGETRETACTACTRSVTITVTDVDEPPAAPDAPTVVSGKDADTSTDPEESTMNLFVVWHAPENTGPRNLTYEVEYKKSTETAFSDLNVTEDQSNRTATITGLDADTSYDVRVRATNGENDSLENWSFVGTGSTNKEGNSPPQSTDNTIATRNVDENTPSGENIGSPVSASDLDTTTLTYSLGGPDAGLFSFNTRTGQLRTKAPLNHEDPRCYNVSNDPTTCHYYVTVTVVDGAGGSDATGIRIVVGDRTEPASAPARPTVGPTEKLSTSLDVSWSAPQNGGPDVVSYDVQWRKGSDPFSDDNCGETGVNNCLALTGTSVKIVDLEDDTTYEVRVKANNGERASAWSSSGSGRTSRANHDPIFDDRPGTGTGSERNSTDGFLAWRTIDENPRSGQVVGRIFADDEDNDRLTYKLIGEDAGKFDFNETNGEIRTKSGETYNYEGIPASGTCGALTEQQVGTDRCYEVMVEVRDGLDVNRAEVEETDADDSITVKIGVRNRDEAPSAPTLMVTSPAINGGEATLVVFWEAENTGPTPITYDVQYRKGSAAFLDDNCQNTTDDDNCNGLTDTTTTITGLDEDTSYSVQVRAKNEEGTSGWSRLETLKTNNGNNAVPIFTDTDPATREINENSPSRDVGNPVNAEDLGSTSLTYSLGGPDSAVFTIVASSGQIRARSSLNHEDPACGYDSTAQTTSCTYNVRVKADDRAGGSASKVVNIRVIDVEEPPIAPSALRVTATKDTGWSLDVTWTAPRNTGKPPINDYDIQYRKVKSGTDQDPYQNWPHAEGGDSTETSAVINMIGDPAMNLEPRTQYEVRVKAKNGENDNDATNWSSPSRGTTGSSNSRPEFDREVSVIELRVDENTRAGQNLGNAISASDADSNSLTYTLEGPGKDSFTIVSSSGQIRTRAALNYEERSSYSLTVKVDDRQRKDNSIAAKSVTVMVDDIREPPSAPSAPTVAGIPGSTDSVRVTWDEPTNTGPSITGYDVHYRETGQGWGRWSHTSVDRSTIITGLKAGTRYEAQIRARSDEGTSEWSRAGSGMPNPDVANRNPEFSGGGRSLSIAENTPPNTDIGAPIAATDRDGDTLTYTFDPGQDADSFDILSTSDGGQIRTSAELNFEEKSSYSVTVRVTDGRGGTDAANVTIRVTDVDDEAPAAPLGPTVTPVSSTSLQVSWEEPDNTGPPITDYDYRYREVSGSWTEVTNTTITGTTVTIEQLRASTSYDVAVRAKNAEGTSDWSSEGSGQTNDAGANNPPVFTEGTTATRSVSATSPAGTNIGDPIAATDADSGDTITYSLEGRDAATFEIDDTNGQLRTSAALVVGETYSVTVAADDGTDITRISVSIEATAAPPNNPPVFTDGASTTRTVRDDATAGRAVGSPVTATDADAGDTITYSLEGTDQASFGIVASSGQIQTSAALDASTKSTYEVTVRATDSNGGSATIVVTITVTAAPLSYGCATDGAVTDTSNTGLVADCEALMASRNLLEGTTGRLNWSPSTPINQWEGVSLRGTPARVTFLDLSSESLDGTVPADLGRLSMLRWLNLRSNSLTGSIPAELNNLTRLERLLLHNNRLSGPIPNLSGLRNLKMLWLSGRDMNLTGNLPSWLNSMSSLEQLSLWGNELSGPIPRLTGMTSLSLLKLQSNNFTDGVPAWFGDMNGPSILYLHDNQLTGEIPANLGRNTGVVRLWLDRNNLSGDDSAGAEPHDQSPNPEPSRQQSDGQHPAATWNPEQAAAHRAPQQPADRNHPSGVGASEQPDAAGGLEQQADRDDTVRVGRFGQAGVAVALGQPADWDDTV